MLEVCGVAAEPTEALYETKVVNGGDGGRKLLDIGGVTASIMTADETNAMLVPSIVFYDNPQHTAVMRDMLKDLELGEHLLLVGNQVRYLRYWLGPSSHGVISAAAPIIAPRAPCDVGYVGPVLVGC